jgi:hypothetical protein
MLGREMMGYGVIGKGNMGRRNDERGFIGRRMM